MFSWERDQPDHAHDDATFTDSTGLEQYFLRLYCTGTLSAKDVCLMAHEAITAGARGELLEKLALGPGRQTGKYAQHLRSVLPEQTHAPELHYLDVPVTSRNHRTTKSIPVSPPHECLDAELERLRAEGTMIEGMLVESEWSDVYENHPHRHRPSDPRPVVPIAIYLDGIKYTRSIGPGHADSLMAVTCYNSQRSAHPRQPIQKPRP